MIRDVLIVLAVFTPLRFALFPPLGIASPLQLPEDAYRQPVILWEALASPGLWLLVAAAFVPVAALRWARSGEELGEGLTWDAAGPRGSRWLVAAAALPLVWKLTTYDVNLWLGQAHVGDRLLLTGFWVGALLTPVLVPLVVAQAAILAFQFHHPDAFVYTWADKSLSVNLLLLFTAVYIASRFVRIRVAVFPFLVLTAVGASYLYPALSKMAAGPEPWSWALENPVHQLVLGAVLNGWLPDADGVALAQSLVPYDRAITVGTLVVELGMLALLATRRVALVLLVAGIGMHLGVFALTGILFWEWMVPEIALAWLLLGPWGCLPRLFTRRGLVLSIVLMLGAAFWLHPHLLGWMDTRYVTTYDLVATSESGRVLEISRDAMDPYHLPFTQNRFSYTRREPDIPTGTYGSAGGDGRLYAELRDVRSAEELREVRARLGTAAYDPVRTASLRRFLDRFARRMNAREGDNELLPSWLEAPHHIYSPRGHDWPAGDPVRTLALVARTTWFDGERLHPIGESVVVEVRPGE